MRMNSHYIYSLRQNPTMGYVIAVGELIDNALQAHATRIEVTFGKGTFTIHDNGIGVSPDGFEALYTLGGHEPVRGSRWGTSRHGRGAKDALAWLWGVTTITSSHDRRRRRLVIDWEHEANKGLVNDTALAPVQSLPPGRPGPSFTRIQVSSHIRADIALPLFLEALKRFGHMYRPALAEGVTLILSRFGDAVPVVPSVEPARRLDAPMVDTRIRVAGRPVHVRAYVTQDVPEYGGLHIALGGRVMDQIHTSVHARNVYGWVILERDDWETATDKTAITDVHRGALDRAVEAVCTDVLAAAEKITRKLVIEELQISVKELLHDVLRTVGVRPAMMVDHSRRGRPRHDSTGPKPERPAPGPESGRTPSPNIPMIENPDEWWEDDELETNVPEVAYEYGPMPSGELAELKIDPAKGWTIRIDDNHPIINDYLEERILGNAGKHKGIDDSRTVMLLANVIAVTSITNDDVAQALPFLAGYAPAQRWGIAAAHLMRTLLERRRRPA